MMQEVVDQAELKDLIEKYGISEEFQTFFSSWNIEKRYKYTNMTALTLNSICQKINYKKNKGTYRSSLKRSALWMKGQFKLFVWVAAFYIFNLQIAINQLKRKDFELLAAIFVKKSVDRMKYQLKSIFHTERCPRKRWGNEEIQMLKSILEKYQSKNKKPQWKSIAFELFSKSQGRCFRTFGQCRQLWTNHLNHMINKDKWTSQEDELLLRQVSQNYKKWSKISQKFEGKRSGHMIKNRYLTLMKRNGRPQLESTKIEEQELVYSSNKQQPQQVLQYSSRLPTAVYIMQSQNSSHYNISLQKNYSGQLVDQLQKKESKNQNANGQAVPIFPSFDQNWFFSLQNQLQMSLIDYGSAQIAKFFSESNLLNQLGCSHYEQIQLAFQEEEAGISIETQE